MCNYHETNNDKLDVEYKTIELYPYPGIPTINGRIYPRDALEQAIKDYKRDFLYVEVPSFTHDYGSSAYEVDLMKVIGTIDKNTFTINDAGNIEATLMISRIKSHKINPVINALVKVYDYLTKPVYAFRGVGNTRNNDDGTITISDYKIISVIVFQDQGQIQNTGDDDGC